MFTLILKYQIVLKAVIRFLCYITLSTWLLSSCSKEGDNNVYYNKETTTYLYIDSEELSIHPPHELQCSRFKRVDKNTFEGKRGLAGELETLEVNRKGGTVSIPKLDLSFESVQKIEYDSISVAGIRYYKTYSKDMGNMKRIDVLAHMILNEDYIYMIDEYFGEQTPIRIDVYKDGTSIKNLQTVFVNFCVRDEM